MEPDQIVSALRRHAPLALAHVVLGAVIGLGIAFLSPPVYSSHTKALVAADGGDGTQAVSSASSVITSIMPTLVEIGTSQSVVDQVAASTGIDRSKVAGAVTLSNPTNSLIIDVTARAASPEEAQAIAQGEITVLRGEIGNMSIQKENSTTLTLTDIDPASLPTSPSGPSRLRYSLIGAVIGAVLGAGTALLMSKLNPAPATGRSRAAAGGDGADVAGPGAYPGDGAAGYPGGGTGDYPGASPGGGASGYPDDETGVYASGADSYADGYMGGGPAAARVGRRTRAMPPSVPLSHGPTGSGTSSSAPLT